MKKKLKNWAIGVIGTIITGVAITVISEKLTSDPYTPFCWLWGWLLKIMNYEIKIWVILLFLGIIYLIIRLLPEPEKTKKHPFADYTSDTINGDKWAWKWNEYLNHIDGVCMFCPEDDTIMMRVDCWENGQSGFECPRCRRRKNFSGDDFNRLQAIIYDNARKRLRGRPAT
ncbi:MAG: hypothetical protein LBK94_05825 [Prevotellaceae bacterium]|jgi:hypothetical protein|nr:hypothetical protein [Prevotellaceae bacterium]